MSISGKPRALVVVGAGASVEYGIPGTIGFGELIDEEVRSDGWCRKEGGTDVYFDVKGQLLTYYQSTSEAHFERLYHVLHELRELHLTPGAAPKFRPVMYPFVRIEKPYKEQAVQAAAQAMLRGIYKKTSDACDSPKVKLDPLALFLSALESRFLPRVYTTNYDDFFEQAGANRFLTGFSIERSNCHLFDPGAYWSNWEEPGCFHIHGSVRMGFPHPMPDESDIGDNGWFASRADALPYAEFTGSTINRMDGTGLARSAIITGLDKLGRIQQSPFASYYAGLAREAMEADVIFVLGSGLADLHLNACLETARRYRPRVPLLYVGYWPGDASDLFEKFHFEHENLETALFHNLRVDLARAERSAFKATDGWTIDSHRTAAVWADGFQSFLNRLAGLTRILTELGMA